MLILVALLASANFAYGGENAANQLVEFLKEHPEPEGIITTSWGKPVTWREANYGLDPEESLIANHFLFESMSSFAKERLAPRGVHPKGVAAHGYFEVTHDVSWITDVDAFNGIGKKTPVFMRFSQSIGDKGTPELFSRSKGNSIKFYTQTGNMDFAGFNIDTFFVKDPFIVVPFNHILTKNPKTRLADRNMFWDFISKAPEALNAFLQTLTLLGQPKSFATMPGHAVHTYQVENSKGQVNFIKVNWYPDVGIQNMTMAEYNKNIVQPDYLTLDLYNRIAAGKFPTYTLTFQVIPAEDIEKTPFDITDVTLNWPTDKYPEIPVGKIVLNKNVDNFQAETEMSAWNPGNLPLGIRGIDKIFEARILVYREGHMNRLGSGFNKIPINCPLSPSKNYQRDGAAPVGDNGGDAPNYYPNSFNGPIPINKTYAPLYRPDTDPAVNNYWQVRNLINKLSPYDLHILLTNVAKEMNVIMPFIKDRTLAIFEEIDANFASQVQDYIKKEKASA